MAAPNFKKAIGNSASTTSSSSITNSDTTIPLTSDTNFQADGGEGMVLIDEGQAAEELAYSTGLSGGSLTIPLANRGLEGGSAQAHASGASVKGILTAGMWNDLVDGVLVEHNDDGTHSDMTADSIDLNAIDDNITVGGSNPYRTITLMPGFLKPTTTAGCSSSTTVEAGTNDIDYDVLDFATGSDENAYANFHMPDSWDAGAIQFRYIWTSAGATPAETVTFELSGRSYANDDAIDQAVGTAVEVADTLIATGDVHISAWSSDVTLAGTPAAGELVHIELMRDVSEDNVSDDARLIALQIRYKQASYSD